MNKDKFNQLKNLIYGEASEPDIGYHTYLSLAIDYLQECKLHSEVLRLFKRELIYDSGCERNDRGELTQIPQIWTRQKERLWAALSCIIKALEEIGDE